MAENYGNDSIISLGILGGVREKPSSVGIESHNHTFIEILANAIDEANAGFGDKIIVTKHRDLSVSIRDFGRGVPMDKNKDGEYAYKKIFDEFFAGGKYENNEGEDVNYKYSLGTNGLGACATNYTADFFIASAWYDNGKKYSIKYEKGIENDEGLVTVVDNNKRGTKITWCPSEEVFRGKGEVDDEFIIKTLNDQSIVNGGLKFTFINEKTVEEQEFYYENGIADYIKSLSNEDHMLTDVISLTTEQRGKDNESDSDYQIKADIYFAFNRETSFDRYYHNSSWLENGGTPEDFVKNSFTFIVDKFLKEKNMYNKSEKKISFEDVADSLTIVTSTYSTISLFTDQTKKKIGSDFMKKAITEWLREQLSVYLIENPLEAERITQQILINKRSREKAEKTRLDVRKKLSGNVNNISNRVEGFIDCRSKDPANKELFIVEGRSALGAILQGRDSQFQSIFPIRGKILSCLKASMNKIFSSELILNIYKIIGCGVELKNKNKDMSTFDLDNLKYDKIIICSDGDVDGWSIRTLLLTMFYVLSPTLLKEGKVYVVEAPLFEIYDIKKDNTHFAYTEEERDSVIKDNKLTKYTIDRNKGLGEMNSEAVAETLMNPKSRKLVQIKVENENEMKEYFELFMGGDVSNRRDYIIENFDKFEYEI